MTHTLISMEEQFVQYVGIGQRVNITAVQAVTDVKDSFDEVYGKITLMRAGLVVPVSLIKTNGINAAFVDYENVSRWE